MLLNNIQALFHSNHNMSISLLQILLRFFQFLPYKIIKRRKIKENRKNPNIYSGRTMRHYII